VVDYEKVYGVQSEIGSVIRLDVKSNILSKVIEYFTRSHASGGDHHWVTKFIDVDLETLCDLIIVSYFICLCKID
jgi:hypothetical protein